jgi:hypothetical protein
MISPAVFTVIVFGQSIYNALCELSNTVEGRTGVKTLNNDLKANIDVTRALFLTACRRCNPDFERQLTR